MQMMVDSIIKNPISVDSDASAITALESLIKSEAGFVSVLERKSITGIITFHSAIRACRGKKQLQSLKAADLASKPLPDVSSKADLSALIKKLSQHAVVAVKNEKDLIEGFLTVNAVLSTLAEKFEELERELAAVINFSSDEILVADGKGKILRANEVFEEHFGVKLNTVLGKTVDDLEKKKIFFPSVTRLVLNHKTTQTVIQSRRDGRKLLATGTPVFNADGSIFRVVVNTRDITRLNRLKQQLEEAELLKNRYQQELVELRQGYLSSSIIVSASRAMKELIKVAARIAAVDSTVLLTGESGSGKGMIARYIHQSSPRADKPFTVVNCGAIPENLLESELFGYAGGAFTGARREGKIGKLELANKGTLFLDEITELPLNLQVKLLHVIQEGVISRIGGTRDIKLNLRFIAATNRDINRLVEEGKFREDLFFRLDVIPLRVPSLYERRDDIRPLTEQFLEKMSHRYGHYKIFTNEAYKILEKYSWPGNVRELENLIERMFIVVDGDEIGIEHLPRHLTDRTSGRDRSSFSTPEIQPLKEAREEMEKKLFSAALRSCRTTYEIAEALQIDQSTVVRKLKKYGLGFKDL
jgi:PAS domain S-box-containing protein